MMSSSGGGDAKLFARVRYVVVAIVEVPAGCALGLRRSRCLSFHDVGYETGIGVRRKAAWDLLRGLVLGPMAYLRLTPIVSES